MRNMSSVISGHNKTMTRKAEPQKRECNCRNREQCPLGNKCLTENIVYEGHITSHPDEVERDYRGLCSTTFKARLGVHNEGFNHRQYSKSCELSEYVWELKDNEKTFDIKWKILKKVNGRLVGGACKLCTTEKLLIIEHPDKEKLLNSNCIQKFRHEAKYMLSQFDKIYRSRTVRGNDVMD